MGWEDREADGSRLLYRQRRQGTCCWFNKINKKITEERTNTTTTTQTTHVPSRMKASSSRE